MPAIVDSQASPAAAPAATAQPFRQVAVLGAGVMGAQIAAHFANAGLRVLLLDIAPKERPRNGIVEASFARMLKLKPAPLVTETAARRIALGNFEDDLERIREADWILEAVIEKLDIKRQLMARIEPLARPEAIITTNTSGLPIHQIAEGRGEDFRRRFLGTHFFNPPRYLRLFEVIPTPDTDPAIVQRLTDFARVHLGKGVVLAKDTPNFIGNRIGVYAMMVSLSAMTQDDYSIEEVDALTGTLVGHPKSATFRTADVVGLDTMAHVANNLYEAVPDDESRAAFQVPDLLRRLIDAGALGSKTGGGFYKKVGKEIQSVDPETLEYRPARPLDLGDLDAVRKAGNLPARLRVLYEDSGRAGAFMRRTTLATLAYAARRIPEISDRPADVDRAIRWGFGWELGPFETWDALGFQRVLKDLREAGESLPEWVSEMEKNDASGFYQEEADPPQAYVPGAGLQEDRRPADEMDLARIARRSDGVVWSNPEAALLDLGDGVALFEFRSKANSMGRNVMEGLVESIGIVERGSWAGMVIGNQGRNFSVGANLGELAYMAQQGRFADIAKGVSQFQQAIQRVRYAAKPVVAAIHSQVLGGACELSMACARTVAATETYIGLVELGAGVIPAGTGTMEMTARAAERASDEQPSPVQEWVAKAFQAIATAKVALSAQNAVEVGYLLAGHPVAMNAERRFEMAKQEVLCLSRQGYLPPPRRVAIYVLGRPGKAVFQMVARTMAQGGFATEYEAFLAERLARIMTGGDIDAPAVVHEDYLLELERETFLSLLGEKKTQERIEHILTKNKPLRN